MKHSAFLGAGRPDELTRTGEHLPRAKPSAGPMENWREFSYSIPMQAAIDRAMAYSWARLPSGPT